ncbi:unnamed protein product [Cylindrotheca closterium]|uniref:Prenylcysteine lyase domain-containing protein n=1 Tax=Cylindrotheca closterium TaxID=2856 RepID=A0AAD2FND6_9STRA|nr:unnamed protein product [Cylindrotheca closterium]
MKPMMFHFMTFPSFILILLSSILQSCHCVRIGVIGGGISGTFVSKYLVDFLNNDDDCSSLQELTIFDPNPIGELTDKKASSNNDNDWQGSRVSSYRLDDGRIVELGASVLTDQFKLILEMAKEANVTVGPPFFTGENETKRDGMAIYNGNGETMFNTANSTISTMRAMAWRYNMDLLKLYRITSKMIERFDAMQDMLLETKKYFFESPKEMWDEAHLGPFVDMSIADLCDYLWIPQVLPWWRKLLPGQGSIRSELLESMLLVNYNQGNSQINAVTGLGSFSASSHSKMHSIVGGNAQLISSAFAQAQKTHSTKCPDTPDVVVSHSQQRVSTVVGSLDGFEVFASDGSLLGHYDIMVLAAPLAFSKVEFLINSQIDSSVLQPMPMGGLVENHEDTRYGQDHEGHNPLPHHLSKAATRTYTQVVTTLVRHGELQHDYFSIDPDHIPRVIVFTEKGKAAEHNITSIAQISPKDGLYKIFSSEPLTLDLFQKIFGSSVTIEYEKIWGGEHGGATPDYQGTGDSTEFLLYDGATGFSGHTTSGGLYYPNSLELSFACIELSAMGAKAVAKLIAKRLGWVEPEKVSELGEEL